MAFDAVAPDAGWLVIVRGPKQFVVTVGWNYMVNALGFNRAAVA